MEPQCCWESILLEWEISHSRCLNLNKPENLTNCHLLPCLALLQEIPPICIPISMDPFIKTQEVLKAVITL